MNVLPIKTPKQAKNWLDFPLALYKNQPNYLHPLNREISRIFDRAKNPYFKEGNAKRWLLVDEQGSPIGRIAAFHRGLEEDGHKMGGIGFFESHNNKEAAKMMFQVAEDWLASEGIDIIEGPINFGQRDRWWGLLVEGFHQPIFGMPYHQPYYQKFFLELGYQDYFQQYTYLLDINVSRPERIKERALPFLQDSEYQFSKLDKSRAEKYAQDFRVVYNAAWAKHSGLKTIGEEEANALMKKMLPVAEEELMCFVYHKKKPVALLVGLPDLNQYFAGNKGRLNWFTKLQFAWKRKRKSVRQFQGVLFGIIPEYQGLGIESAITMSMDAWFKKDARWDSMEIYWVGDFNPKMLKTVDYSGARKIRTHITYRKMLNQSIPFKRCKSID